MKQLVLILLLIFSMPSIGQRAFLLESTKSPIGSHHLYHASFEGLPVFNQYIKKNIFQNQVNVYKTEINPRPVNKKLNSTDKILHTSKGYIQYKDHFIRVQSTTFINDSESFTLFITENNETIHHINHKVQFKDTIIYGSVFFPDPITTSQQNYGPPYVDGNDESNDDLNRELVEVAVSTRFENDSFILENKHIKITNQSSPDILPTTKENADFRFNRSQIGFEEVHALYHITNFAQYLKDTLGFNALLNEQIYVDVYALNGKDNSEFINSTVPPRINFGQGGIDDAEDPDILIHEYAHAVSNAAAPGSLEGYERKALDEGISDYWAAVYSKKLNAFNYKKIFNWDGHNEFWEGRSLENDRKYSDGLNGNKYVDGELFGATLLDIRSLINDTVCDKLIMQSNYSWFPNMSFPQAAEQIIKADSILYAGYHANLLFTIFYNRGFFDEDYGNSTNDNIWVPILNYDLLQKGIVKIENQSNSIHVELYSLSGQLVWRERIQSNYAYTLPSLSRGIYFLRVNNHSFRMYLDGN